MARLPLRDAEHLEPADRHLLERPINLFRVLANSPEALRRFGAFGEWIRHDCELDPRLREMAILQVAYSTGSEYEWSHHIEIGRTFGVTDNDIRAIAAESRGEDTSLGQLERTALRVARELTIDGNVSQGTWNELASHLPAGRLVDLVAVVAFYDQAARVIAGLQVEVEPEYLDYLAEFPLGVPG